MKKGDQKCLGRRDASIPWEDVWFASSELLLKSLYCLITGVSNCLSGKNFVEVIFVWISKLEEKNCANMCDF